MLDIDTNRHQIVEVLGVLTKVVQCHSRMRVQRRHIQQRHIVIHVGFGIDVTAQTQIRTTEHIMHPAIFASDTLVTRESVDDVRIGQNIRLDLHNIIGLAGSQIRIHQPRMLFLAKYNTGRQTVGSVVDSHAGNICQNLTRNKVCLPRVKYGFCRNDIVVAVFCNLLPLLFRHRLIPRKPELLMVDAQLDLKLLQALLFCAEVVNIRVGEVIRLTEKARMFIDDLLRQIIDCLNRPPNHAGIQDVVIVLAVVETDQTILRKHCNIICTGVDHAMNHRLVAALKLPVD